MGTVLRTATVAKFTRREPGPSIKFPNREDLVVLTELIEEGKVRPLIGRTYLPARGGCCGPGPRRWRPRTRHGCPDSGGHPLPIEITRERPEVTEEVRNYAG